MANETGKIGPHPGPLPEYDSTELVEVKERGKKKTATIERYTQSVAIELQKLEWRALFGYCARG